MPPLVTNAALYFFIFMLFHVLEHKRFERLPPLQFILAGAEGGVDVLWINPLILLHRLHVQLHGQGEGIGHVVGRDEVLLVLNRHRHPLFHVQHIRCIWRQDLIPHDEAVHEIVGVKGVFFDARLPRRQVQELETFCRRR